MRFDANSVSASGEGDYYQIWIEANDSTKETGDPFEVDGPYVIVQRDFEMPYDGRFLTPILPIPILCRQLSILRLWLHGSSVRY
jgi:hypothetical protein